MAEPKTVTIKRDWLYRRIRDVEADITEELCRFIGRCSFLRKNKTGENERIFNESVFGKLQNDSLLTSDEVGGLIHCFIMHKSACGECWYTFERMIRHLTNLLNIMYGYYLISRAAGWITLEKRASEWLFIRQRV